MPLMLFDPDRDLMLLLPLDTRVVEALQEQCRRADPDKLQRLADRLAQAVRPVVETYLDWDLRPPTHAQIQYALAIARRAGVEIPEGVLKKRNAMSRFLDEHTKPSAGGLRQGGPSYDGEKC